jgi:predicted alpha/beta hydrolase
LDHAKPKLIDEQVSLPTEDGYTLGGTYFVSESILAPDLAIVINCGIGIASRHYRHFARFLASAGFSVLTYDYRGMGLSRPRTLKNFPATIEDWSEYDCTAATRWMSNQCASARLIGIGHSFGSLLFGGSRAASLVSEYVMICPHTGYYGDYGLKYRIPMSLVWHTVMPAITRLFGYFPARRLRLGDDLPKGVALQWGDRRTPTNTVNPGDRLARIIEDSSRISAPAVLVTISDDSFGTAVGAARVRDYFPGLDFQSWSIRPADVGLRKIGHFGFFRRDSANTLWPQLVTRLL